MLKIVIVEDLPMMLEGLKLLIERVKDFRIVAEYTNGKEFMDNLHSNTADIVLMDIDMPVMDGIEATRMAVSLVPDIKVIALTMYNDRKFYYKMVTAGARGFVLKQSPSNELETAIREVYQGGNFFSPELLRTVIVEMQGIEKEILQEKKDRLKLTEREIV